jgi:hypothetical protein
MWSDCRLAPYRCVGLVDVVRLQTGSPTGAWDWCMLSDCRLAPYRCVGCWKLSDCRLAPYRCVELAEVVRLQTGSLPVRGIAGCGQTADWLLTGAWAAGCCQTADWLPIGGWGWWMLSRPWCTRHCVFRKAGRPKNDYTSSCQSNLFTNKQQILGKNESTFFDTTRTNTKRRVQQLFHSELLGFRILPIVRNSKY